MIRRAVPSDLPDILEIYAIARRFMAQAGTPDQWRDVYPPEDLVQDDIRQGFCHVCVLDGRIQGVFAAMCWDDPDYQVIQGAWLNDRPYWAVHRVASRGEVRGVASRCLLWCLERGGSVRIDTHPANRPMQRVLDKNGFTLCGTVWMEDGSPRLAYQREVPAGWRWDSGKE